MLEKKLFQYDLGSVNTMIYDHTKLELSQRILDTDRQNDQSRITSSGCLGAQIYSKS